MQDRSGMMGQGSFRRFARRLTALWAITVAVCANNLSAETYMWSTNTTGAAQDGSGTWNTSTANWVGTGEAHAIWNNANGDTAAFGAGGTAGTVTVATAGITVGGLVFNAAVTNGTYVLGGGPLTLTGAPTFVANTNATLAALIAGEAGVVKTGAGALWFSNPNNTFTGDVAIAGGTVVCNAMNQGGTNSALGRANVPRTVAVGAGATLLFNAHDTFGNDSKKPAVTISVESGGTIRNAGTFTTLGALNLAGGTVVSAGGANSGFQAYSLKGAVTSGGDSSIATTGGNYNGVHLNDTLVAVTGGTLAVSAPLLNKPGGSASKMTKAGAGRLALAADNSFSGGLTVSNGTLLVGSGGSAGSPGSGAICLVSNRATLVFNRSGALTVSAPISGDGALVQQGALGLVTLSGANTYSGGTAISNGLLAVTGTNALPGYGVAGKVTLSPGAGLSIGVGSWSDADIAALIGTGVYGSDTYFGFDTSAGNYTYTGQFALPTVAGLVKTGPNALTLSGSTGCAGGVAVFGGILQADFGAGIPAATNVTLAAASLSSASGSLTNTLGTGAGQINMTAGTACGFSAVDVPLTVNLGGAGESLLWGSAVFSPSALVLNDTGANTNLTLVNGINLNGATRTINVNSATAGSEALISGEITNGGLIKGGSGRLALSAASTFSGGTTVNAGTLALCGGNDRLSTAASITVNSAKLDLGGYAQALNAGNFVMANGAVVQNGAVKYRNVSWSPSSGASVAFGVGGGFICSNRMVLMGGQTVTLSAGAGSVCFGGDTGGSANFIGVDNVTTNAIIVNGGSLDYTHSLYGAGYLRIAANLSRPYGSLTVNDGAVNIGHSMNMGAKWDNSAAECNGVAALTINGGEVNVGTGASTATAGGNRGWLYLGNGHASTVSRSTINLNGGTLSLIQFECGAYGTNTVNFNGGTLKARADNASFVNGARLVCNVGAGGALIDTDGHKVGLNANLLGSGISSRLVKRGAGTLTFGGSNTCSGATVVEQGTLALSAGAVFPSTVATPLSDEALGSLKLRLDASVLSGLFTNSNGSGAVTVSGQPVGYWADLSGSGKHATQANTAYRPTYVADVSEFNGLPVIQFDGVDDDITSLFNINATSISNLTVMMVFRQVTCKVNGGLWGHDNGGWDRFQLLNFFGVGNNNIATSNTSVNVKGMNTNAVLIYSAVLRNGVTNGSCVYVNGLSDSENGLPAFSSEEGPGQALFTLANISPGNGYQGHIQIGEVMVFDAALRDSARLNAEAYLRDKWRGVPGRMSLAAGAVLDLGGAIHTLSSVSGDGAVSNGTLTVLDPLSPAGDDMIGTQKVSNVALNGTLRVNVTESGACDQLVCTGDLTVTGLALQIVNPDALNRARAYAVIRCTDLMTGPFQATNLPDDWHIRYNQAAGTAVMYYAAPGTVITLK